MICDLPIMRDHACGFPDTSSIRDVCFWRISSRCRNVSVIFCPSPGPMIVPVIRKARSVDQAMWDRRPGTAHSLRSSQQGEIRQGQGKTLAQHRKRHQRSQNSPARPLCDCSISAGQRCCGGWDTGVAGRINARNG